MNRALFYLWILTLPAAALAGSKGFSAVFLDIGNQGFFDQPPYTTRRDGEYSPLRDATECWHRQATGGERFAWLIRKKLPEGMTVELARRVWNGDRAAMESVQEILKKSKSPDGDALDGIYVINARDGKISMMALGARGPLGPKNPSKKVSIPWNKSDPAKGAADFDLALCSIAKPLGFGFAP